MSRLRERLLEALDEAGFDGPAVAEVVMPIVDEALHNARHTIHGRCRYCRGILKPEMYPGPMYERAMGHRMECRFYVGPLEHQWVTIKPNGTFGGMDHFCTCGGWFRQGGSAGHGDGSPEAEAVCPNTDQEWRGPRDGPSGITDDQQETA